MEFTNEQQKTNDMVPCQKKKKKKPRTERDTDETKQQKIKCLYKKKQTKNKRAQKQG